MSARYTVTMTDSAKRFAFVLFVLAVIIAILIGLNTFLKSDVTDAINSFEDCADAGYPIMESYPEQCAVPGGQTFTKQR